jgi:putative ABC transport system substrate-binding protein
MIGRRDFITLLGGAAAVWPLSARAERAEPWKRVGVLNGSGGTVFEPRYMLFRDAVARLGWTEPGQLWINYRSTGGYQRNLMEAHARELVSLAPDVIFSAIPIVFTTATDPVAAGYVQSYAHPGHPLINADACHPETHATVPQTALAPPSALAPATAPRTVPHMV